MAAELHEAADILTPQEHAFIGDIIPGVTEEKSHTPLCVLSGELSPEETQVLRDAQRVVVSMLAGFLVKSSLGFPLRLMPLDPNTNETLGDPEVCSLEGTHLPNGLPIISNPKLTDKVRTAFRAYEATHPDSVHFFLRDKTTSTV